MSIQLSTLFIFISISISVSSQVLTDMNALFLGNSYTAYNNLPQLIADCASSTGRSLTFEANTPGGQTFEGHTNNSTSINLIAQGDWDFVVLQEQSQLPSFPEFQVEQDVFPFAEELNDTILHFNECAETVFYMTWGRENGDSQNCANWPPVCTYEGMDDLLQQRYRQMALDNQAILSPAGALWRSIRANHPEIDLYASDGSHPSAAGSYAAAVCFYTVFYRADPTDITFNFSLTDAEASAIREEAKTIVHDQLLSEWYVGEFDDDMSACYTPVSIIEPTSASTAGNFVFATAHELIFQQISGESDIACFDISGKLVFQIRITSDLRYPIQLPQGIYIFHLQTAHGEQRKQKIVVQ